MTERSDLEHAYDRGFRAGKEAARAEVAGGRAAFGFLTAWAAGAVAAGLVARRWENMRRRLDDGA